MSHRYWCTCTLLNMHVSNKFFNLRSSSVMVSSFEGLASSIKIGCFPFDLSEIDSILLRSKQVKQGEVDSFLVSEPCWAMSVRLILSNPSLVSLSFSRAIFL